MGEFYTWVARIAGAGINWRAKGSVPGHLHWARSALVIVKVWRRGAPDAVEAGIGGAGVPDVGAELHADGAVARGPLRTGAAAVAGPGGGVGRAGDPLGARAEEGAGVIAVAHFAVAGHAVRAGAAGDDAVDGGAVAAGVAGVVVGAVAGVGVHAAASDAVTFETCIVTKTFKYKNQGRKQGFLPHGQAEQETFPLIGSWTQRVLSKQGFVAECAQRFLSSNILRKCPVQ